MILIDLTYYCNKDVKDIPDLLEKQKESLGYIDFIKKNIDIRVVKHARFSKKGIINGVPYLFFKGSNRFLHVPLSAIRYIKKEKPDVIIVQGLIFPLQTLLLRWMTRTKSIILVQHHGELPFGLSKRFLQQWMDRFVDGYLFTAKGNALPWLEQKIIRNSNRCYEVQEASVSFIPKDKKESRAGLGLSSGTIFLWVGRLDANKDPITVLKGFERFIQIHPDAHLYMIFQTEDLLPAIKYLLHESSVLQNAVHLVGKIAHNLLPAWYSAADVFVSGSHNESCGFALLEAMACGCIPLVTQIPSFQKFTCIGRFGFLFECGNDEDFFKKAQLLDASDKTALSKSVMEHFNESLSYKAIATGINDLCRNLVKE